jgi:membrane protein required for colicin V production
VTWIDWLIVIAMGMAIYGGLKQGFLRSVCSLGGLFFGLMLAAWNYDVVAGLFLPIVRFEALANVLGFLLVVFVVTLIANMVGWMLHRTARTVGLGWLDRLLGGVFGFFQGWLMVTIVILLAAAFFPKAEWLHNGQLPHHFFGSAHFGAHLSPAELARRIREGLEFVEQQAPGWVHGKKT